MQLGRIIAADPTVFSNCELARALGKLNTLKCANEFELVAEMLKRQTIQDTLVAYFNDCLQQSKFDETWHNTIFIVLPKSGSLAMPSNYKPIAILFVLYKLFARTVYNRISPTLIASQSIE